MPIAGRVAFSGTVAASAAVIGTLAGGIAPAEYAEPGFVEPGYSTALGTLVGTVARTFAEADTAPSLVVDVEIVLDGVPVPREALVAGAVELEDSIDTQLQTLSFTLAGREWGVQATQRTWTRTPVELWQSAGPPGAVARWLRFAGYVLTCEEEDGPEPRVRVRCGDPSVLFDRADLCHEVEPLSGLTRGEIVTDVCTDVGVAVDVPAGGVYSKPLITDSRALFDFLRPYGEAVGWSWRFRPADEVLEAYTADLKLEPLPADHTWGPDDFVSLSTSPPADVPSRFVVRGTSMVFADELGVVTRVTSTAVDAVFAPQVAVQKQLTDGSIVASGIPPETEALRALARLEDQVQERGGRTILHLTREWRWFNPRAGKLRTPNGGQPAGPAEGGYYYTEAWIDEAGEFRAWARQAFVQVGERRAVPLYAFDGTLDGVDTAFLAWHSKTMGVKNVGSATLNVVGAAVGGDDQSYFVWEILLTDVRRIDTFGTKEAEKVRYTYEPVKGAARVESNEKSTWYSPRVAIEGNPWYVRYDGTGQKDLVAPWNVFSKVTNTNYFTQEVLLAGKSEEIKGWHVPKLIGGLYDWGDFRSNSLQELYGLTRQEFIRYNVLSTEAYEELIPGKPPKIIVGRLPLPRFRSSAWTFYTQSPFELLLDDPTVEDWFGFSREVVSNEYLQDLAEASAWLTRRRRRLLAHRHQVERPFATARPGDTVLLADPRRGLAHRCLVTARRESWVLAPVTRVVFGYTLEQSLLGGSA